MELQYKDAPTGEEVVKEIDKLQLELS